MYKYKHECKYKYGCSDKCNNKDTCNYMCRYRYNYIYGLTPLPPTPLLQYSVNHCFESIGFEV